MNQIECLAHLGKPCPICEEMEEQKKREILKLIGNALWNNDEKFAKDIISACAQSGESVEIGIGLGSDRKNKGEKIK